MTVALNMEMRKVEKVVRSASAAVTHGKWTEAERALTEVQERVGRLLREVGLKQCAVAQVEPSRPMQDE